MSIGILLRGLQVRVQACQPYFMNSIFIIIVGVAIGLSIKSCQQKYEAQRLHDEILNQLLPESREYPCPSNDEKVEL